MPARTHGHTADRKPTPTYIVWLNLRQRCNDPNHPKYPRYGGRGIACCDRWASFEAFLADMGEKPSGNLTINRIDNDGDYTPTNCEWATAQSQALNKSNNVRFTRDDGESKTIPEWSREFGVSARALYYRLQKHGTIFV